jgi:hypothetical protein
VLIDCSQDQTNKIKKLDGLGLENVVLYNILRVPQPRYTTDNAMSLLNSAMADAPSVSANFLSLHVFVTLVTQ